MDIEANRATMGSMKVVRSIVKLYRRRERDRRMYHRVMEDSMIGKFCEAVVKESVVYLLLGGVSVHLVSRLFVLLICCPWRERGGANRIANR